MNSQFNLLTKGDARVDSDMRRFLSQAYNLKAIAAATRFVACVAMLLSDL